MRDLAFDERSVGAIDSDPLWLGLFLSGNLDERLMLVDGDRRPADDCVHELFSGQLAQCFEKRAMPLPSFRYLIPTVCCAGQVTL